MTSKFSRCLLVAISAVTILAAPSKVIAGIAMPPQIMSPVNYSVTTNMKPRFSWTSSAGFNRYRLQVTKSSDTNFTTPIINTQVVGANYTSASNMPWDTYRWRVKGQQNGVMTAWSKIGSFAIKSSLSTTDEQALNQNLETLAQGWDEAAKESANVILQKPEYSSINWQNYFESYFVTTNHPFTNSLGDYIGYATHHWFDDYTRTKLQEGITPPLWNKMNALLATHTAGGLGKAMEADINLRQSLFTANRYFSGMGREGLSELARQTTYNNYKSLINRYPHYFRAGTIDSNVQPYVPSLRAQVWMSFRDIKTKLDVTTIKDIATTLGLSGRRLDIWNNFTTLVHDNNGLSAAQQGVIFDVMSSIPSGMFTLASITQNEMLGSVGDRHIELAAKSGINVFPNDVGSIYENSFPDDIAEINIDQFTVALAHELSHNIEAQYINSDPVKRARLDQLLRQAGSKYDEQYLRSMVGAAFFQEAPQEFFASIANQWFDDSKHTLDLGVKRLHMGYREPMHQVLYYVDIYSKGGSTSTFYRIGMDGVVHVQQIPLVRDANGRITGLTYQNTVYTFTLDNIGNVTHGKVTQIP